MTNKELVLRWIADDPDHAVDVMFQVFQLLTSGQKTAVRNQIVTDLKARNAEIAAEFDDADADTLAL